MRQCYLHLWQYFCISSFQKTNPHPAWDHIRVATRHQQFVPAMINKKTFFTFLNTKCIRNECRRWGRSRELTAVNFREKEKQVACPCWFIFEIVVFVVFVFVFIATRSYAALRAADLDWIIGPGYSSGRYILEKNHEKPWRTNLEPWKPWKPTWNHEKWSGTMKNRPGTVKNRPGTMKYHENQAGTMKNQPGTMKNHENRTGTMKNHKNQPGIMKNQLGTIKNHENPPRTMKNQPGTIKNHENLPWTMKTDQERYRKKREKQAMHWIIIMIIICRSSGAMPCGMENLNISNDSADP